ncbi:MAG: HAMP domain-containing histidine kinase [Clostridia bacterium]|nr:HAMP domain-containing histidine kinase [Clostridia bacterium]
MSGHDKNKKLYGFMGYLLFFLTFAVAITISIAVFVAINREMDGNTTIITIVMIAIILFFAGVCTLLDYLRRKITIQSPVNKILDATERLAEGDFSVRLDTDHAYGKYNDYDLIMENVNVVARELGKSEILKSDFISNVSHEIKTPVAIIQNYTTLLQSKNLTEEERNGYAKIILDASKRLNSLVTNILKLNKLEHQTITTEWESLNVASVLEESIIGFEEIIDSKSLELEVDIDDVEIISSKTYLELVFNNLLSNAIKFTEKGGKISVIAKKTTNGASVSVTDTGCGISKEAGAHIFDKFYQGDTSHSQEGNGLGLPLVKKVIDILGGSISVQSELGVGSTFTVELKDRNER